MKLVAWLALCLIACKDQPAPAPPAPTPAPSVAAPAPAPAPPVAAPAPPAPEPPADPADGVLVAGHDDVKHEFFIARVSPTETVELFKDGSEPAQLLWVDRHLLIAMFEVQVGDDTDTALRWFVDARPSDKRGKGGEPIKAAAWPPGFRGATTRLILTKSGQVWLGRRALDGAETGQSRYMRVDAFPRKLQAEPPADLDVLRSNPWPISLAAQQDDQAHMRAALPRVATGPEGITLTLKKAAGGIPGVECKDARRTVLWPPAGTHPFLRIHVEEAHWLSAAPPLWTAVGRNPDFPDGAITDAVVFAGCTATPLADVQWLGADVWATHDGGAWSDAKDAKPWVLWRGATRLATVTRANGSVFRTAPLGL
jgi:hypothetical protein